MKTLNPAPSRKALGLLASLALLPGLLATHRADAKLAAERWPRLTEEERHQLTRAERYVEQANFKSAIAEYELFLQLYPKSEVASYSQYMFAECTRKLGKINTAINEFRNVLDYFPDSPDSGPAQFSIGLCQTQTGDTEKAVVAFEKVIAQWPATGFGAEARAEAAAIYWRLNKLDKWLPHIEFLATGTYSDAPALRLPAVRKLVAHRLYQGNVAAAFELLDGKTKKLTLSTFAESAIEALRLQKTGTSYGEKGTKAVATTAASVVSFLEQRARDLSDAEAKVGVEHACAKVLSAAGENDKAAERFSALLKQAPTNDRVRMDYADLLRAKGNRNEARLVYRELKDQFIADREIASTYVDERNLTAAADHYRAMLQKHPQRTNDIQWELGEVLQRAGKFQEAAAAYTASQKEPQALFRVAECQGSMKQHDAAIQTLIGVVNFFKSSAPEAQYRMAGHQAAKGDKEAAIRTLKNVCKIHLNTSWAGKAHQDLTLVYGVDITLGGAAKQAEN